MRFHRAFPLAVWIFGGLFFAQAQEAEQAQEHLRQGLKWLAAKDANAALVYFKKAALLLPKGQNPYVELGRAFGQAQKYNNSVRGNKRARAWAALEEAVERMPSPPGEKRELLGAAYFLLNDNRRAAVTLETLRAADPGHPRACAWLGEIYMRLDRLDLAKDAFDCAIKKQSEDARLHAFLGFVYARDVKHEQAIAYYQEALRLLPEYPEVYYWLADSYAQLNQWNKALECYEWLLKRYPADVRTRRGLGAAYAKMERFEDAKKIFESLYGENPKDGDTLFSLGAVYFYLGDVEKALDYFHQLQRVSGRRAKALWEDVFKYPRKGDRGDRGVYATSAKAARN